MNDPCKYNIVQEDKNLAQKHQVFFIWCKKECPLSFNERLIYSVLVKAERMAGKGTTQVKLCAWTGLSPKTVRSALKDDSPLRTSGLVAKDHSRCCRAVEPPEAVSSWFAARKTNSKHWADRLAYWPVDLSDACYDHPFDAAFVALLHLLKGDGDAVKHECHKSLATLLGCDYRRIKKALDRLGEHQVVEVINTRKNRYGKIVRFDVRFLADSEKQPVDVAVEIEEPSEAEPKVDKPSERLAAWNLQQQERAERVSKIRSIRSMMKERMQKLGYEEWIARQIAWSMERVPTDDMPRVFHAIISKHGESSGAVLREVERYGWHRKWKQRAEERELITLEAMSECVTV